MLVRRQDCTVVDTSPESRDGWRRSMAEDDAEDAIEALDTALPGGDEMLVWVRCAREGPLRGWVGDDRCAGLFFEGWLDFIGALTSLRERASEA